MKVIQMMLFFGLIHNTSVFAQDMAGSSYRVKLKFTNLGLEPGVDSLLAVEFYHGLDEIMNCSLAHLQESKGLKYNLDSLEFELYAGKIGIGSCSRKVKPPTIFIKFIVQRTMGTERSFQYQKFLPIVFESSYDRADFVLDDLDLSDRLGIDSEACCLVINEQGFVRFTKLSEVRSELDWSTLLRYDTDWSK
jgi:hypothetical protein